MSSENGPSNKAVIICLGERYFAGFGKKRRLQTAWSMAGATLFGMWQREQIEKILRLLASKGYKGVKWQIVAIQPFDVADAAQVMGLKPFDVAGMGIKLPEPK